MKELTPIEETRIEIASHIPDLQYVIDNEKDYHTLDVHRANYEMQLYKKWLNQIVNIEADINENYIPKQNHKEDIIRAFIDGFNWDCPDIDNSRERIHAETYYNSEHGKD